MPASCQPFSEHAGEPLGSKRRPRPQGRSHTKLATKLCGMSSGGDVALERAGCSCPPPGSSPTGPARMLASKTEDAVSMSFDQV